MADVPRRDCREIREIDNGVQYVVTSLTNVEVPFLAHRARSSAFYSKKRFSCSSWDNVSMYWGKSFVPILQGWTWERGCSSGCSELARSNRSGKSFLSFSSPHPRAVAAPSGWLEKGSPPWRGMLGGVAHSRWVQTGDSTCEEGFLLRLVRCLLHRILGVKWIC